MEVQSYPNYPAARALCGDYAVQQNENDRSSAQLNTVMEGTFLPVHRPWSSAWVLQQQTETTVAELVLERNSVDSDLDENTRRVFSTLQGTVGKGSPIIKQYIPNGDLAILVRPFARQVSEMEPYAQAISKAPEDRIAPSIRDSFMKAFNAAKDVQGRLDKAKTDAVKAQRAREALDAGWEEGYEEYHRNVEFVAKGDRGVIKRWIRQWPDPAYAGKGNANAPETTGSEGSSGSTAADEGDGTSG